MPKGFISIYLIGDSIYLISRNREIKYILSPIKSKDPLQTSKIPIIFGRRAAGVEFVEFVPFAEAVDAAIFRPDIIGQQGGVVEGAQGIEPMDRQGRRELIIGVAGDRRARILALGEAMMDPGEYRRGHQIGVGVGAGGAVLDAPRRSAAGRNAQGYGAVIECPVLGRRR